MDKRIALLYTAVVAARLAAVFGPVVLQIPQASVAGRFRFRRTGNDISLL